MFDELSLELAAGEILVIEGANGSGKSSLLQLIAGLMTPDKGEIYWQGRCIQEQGCTYLQQLHFLSHHNGIRAGLTVYENLELASCLSQQALIQVEQVLASLQLLAFQHHFASDLSAGQKRRLALAKLFLFKKALWLLDEPCTALDQNMQKAFLVMLENYLDEGGIVIMSSHHDVQLKRHSAKILRLF